MLIIRPIRSSDYEALYQIAEESGHGFTSLPVNEDLLRSKIARVEASFQKQVDKPFDEGYLMVLEDTESGEVVGTCGLEAAVGMEDAFYHYRLGTEVYHSEQIDVRNEVETLTLCHDYTGAAELCTLFLRDTYRKNNNGRMLSRSRFLFLAQHAERFGDTVIAEMRGESDEAGNSPFYDWLQKHFLGIDFVEADYLSGLGQKAFMAEMMPKNAVYVCLLPEEAQKVIGEVHANTRPALNLLQAEGFRCRGYVDIFDGGPTVECNLSDIRSVRESRLLTITIGDAPESDFSFIISNTQLANYRATSAKLLLTEDSDVVTVSPELAAGLLLSEGEQIRVLAM
ncbi:arginine N-succinyltransferase [Shewanella benthica]|uniref:arginine N-succinyltransferase n=1 Tax=Shewanella TaxID=22 RepID=UPI000C0CA802|nr:MULTISPECIES: arginine N-succinyltransferase [Shewanella]MBE7214019.1 arginine N-succinyltransferase [Shewanella benthica]MBL4817259.1 arginine N-succinyltransferase [Shewanella sp.]MCJ8303297.1 arginine N-succinyltransferase [Shewanella sp.]MCL1061260.1 arginine N-succinyltransferase [Shewanella benthica]PHQ76363.1 MAG: arginine N-succinyltransferase [Shewanella sp.]